MVLLLQRKITIARNNNLKNVNLTEKIEEDRYPLKAIYLKQNPKIDLLKIGHFPNWWAWIFHITIFLVR